MKFRRSDRVLGLFKTYSLPDNGADKLDNDQVEKESLLQRFNDINEEPKLDLSAAIETILKKETSQIVEVNLSTDV